MKTVTFKGNTYNLVGRHLKLNTYAPNFSIVDENLQKISLENFTNKIKVITFFLSLDTSVCDLQVKEFNKRALNISDEVVILGISKDLPFAQKRFCESFQIGNYKIYSDYMSSSFGINYGLLIKELNLDARGCIIIDKNDVVRYIQIVPEVTHSVNFEDVFIQLKEIIKNPFMKMKDSKLKNHCIPCEKGTPPLTKNEIEKQILSIPLWQVIEDKKIQREFVFKDFVEAQYFLNLIGIIAEEQGHHPNLTLIYNKLKVTLTTHAIGGLSFNDFIMAKIIDDLIKE
jgi:thiol peroxidase